MSDVLGYDCLKRHGDPLDVSRGPPKLYILEVGGLGEIKWRRHLR